MLFLVYIICLDITTLEDRFPDNTFSEKSQCHFLPVLLPRTCPAKFYCHILWCENAPHHLLQCPLKDSKEGAAPKALT